MLALHVQAEPLPGFTQTGDPLSVEAQTTMKRQPKNPPSTEGTEPFHQKASDGFSPETLNDHRRLKRSSWKHIRSTRLLVILSSPVIYACVLPFLLLDAAVALYQLVCFPIYAIPKVRRGDYLVFDRGRLAYLNTIEKVGCIYCSYANGLLALITEVAARSEQYFCPIKHAQPPIQSHSRYPNFLPYGDGHAYVGQADAIAHNFGDLKARAPAGRSQMTNSSSSSNLRGACDGEQRPPEDEAAR
jgi:hypothetical protein